MKKYIMGLLIFLMFSGCKKTSEVRHVEILNTLKGEQVEELNRLRVFFGHQSVGKNILDGVQKVCAEYGLNINVVEYEDNGPLPESGIIHRRVGENKKPLTKIREFESIIEKLNGEIDIAMLKFCYVDFNESTDVELIFSEYKKTIEKLAQKYPDIHFLHFTVPLRANSGGIKLKIKRILNKPDYTDAANIVRRNFSEKVIAHFGKENVFDIGYLEAIKPDGKLESFKVGDKIYYSLCQEYTYDGGHLNEIGRRYIGRNLIVKLAELSVKNVWDNKGTKL